MTTTRSGRFGVTVLGLLAALAMSQAVDARPDTDEGYSDPDSELEGLAVGSVCVGDAPFIDVHLDGDAALSGREAVITFFPKAQGHTDEVLAVHRVEFRPGTTHRFVYPGASVDSDGNPTDWPGWKFENGEWVVDETDAYLREGITVRVEVNPVAISDASYPPATPACNSGPRTETAGMLPGMLPGVLPQAGGGPAHAIIKGALTAIVIGGFLVTIAVRRRVEASAVG